MTQNSPETQERGLERKLRAVPRLMRLRAETQKATQSGPETQRGTLSGPDTHEIQSGD